MTYDILTNYNFTDAQIEIYRILIEHGESTVSEVLANTSLSRTSVHDALNDLLVRELVEYRKEGRNAYYKAVHPNKLYALLEEKKQTTARLNAEMEEVIRSMVGSYNLGESKPGVRFFEGVEGVKNIFDELLTTTEEMYTFADIEALDQTIADINQQYVQQRIAKQQSKKILILDTPEARQSKTLKNTELTEIRMLPKEMNRFHTGMNIFNNKLVYLTLTQEHMVGLIVEDPHIYSLHRGLFELLWGISTPLFSETS